MPDALRHPGRKASHRDRRESPSWDISPRLGTSVPVLGRMKPEVSPLIFRSISTDTLLRSAASMPFFTRLRRASHFLLRGQEKVTEEKATPMQRSPGILPCDFAKRFRGWLTVHPCTDSQLARIPASHPAGTPPPLRRRIGAPFTAHPAQQNRAEADADSGRRQTSRFSFSPCGRRCRRRMRGALDVALALRCGNCPRSHASAWKTWERRRPRRSYFKSPRRRLTSTPKVSEPIFARH